MNPAPIHRALDGVRIPNGLIRFRDAADLETWLGELDGIEFERIGDSREGQPLFGYCMGRGPRRVTIIAGSHADEPVGPITAQALPRFIQAAWPEWLDAFTFCVVPQVNPDGADRNRMWFANPPDIVQYAQWAVREQPGDDIEFGFGPGGRPECAAAEQFLSRGGPVAAHFSLHGMAYAEGAWFLIAKEWAERAGQVMEGLRQFCRRMQFPLHDVERHGEKGFNRIAPGFCTTPTSAAMRAHFEALGDAETAGRFRPTSMEMAASWGGDPLCMVSELPLFVLGKKSASLEENISAEFKAALQQARAGADPENAISNTAYAYELGPASIQFQVRAQLAMLAFALAEVQGIDM